MIWSFLQFGPPTPKMGIFLVMSISPLELYMYILLYYLLFMIISMNNHIRTKSSLNPEDCNKSLIYIWLPLTTIDIIVISPLDNFPILLVYINNDLEKTSDYISVWNYNCCYGFPQVTTVM